MLDMNRLQLELDRLYGLGANATDGAAAGDGQSNRQRGIRVLVLELARPTGWEQLSSVWKGVQSDLELPAPAIAVSGADGLQVWFSLASPISPSSAERFLHGLRARYLSGVGSTHVRLITDTAELPAAPPVEIGADRWSAFVTPDLASVFADTPWLDIAPTEEGQAAILRALKPIRPAAFDAALDQLGAIAGDAPREAPASRPPDAAAARTCEPADTDPARFLTRVMNDETAPLAVRVDAAKALLGHARGS
jgi:hypothetical protein